MEATPRGAHDAEPSRVVMSAPPPAADAARLEAMVAEVFPVRVGDPVPVVPTIAENTISDSFQPWLAASRHRSISGMSFPASCVRRGSRAPSHSLPVGVMYQACGCGSATLGRAPPQSGSARPRARRVEATRRPFLEQRRAAARRYLRGRRCASQLDALPEPGDREFGAATSLQTGRRRCRARTSSGSSTFSYARISVACSA